MKNKRKKNLSAKRQLARQIEWEVRNWERLCRCPGCEWSRQNEMWELVAAAHAVTPPPRETHLADPRDTHLAVTPLLALIYSSLHSSHLTLKYLTYPSKSQNLCLWCLCFSESVLVLFFLALWLCVCVFVNCGSMFERQQVSFKQRVLDFRTCLWFLLPVETLFHFFLFAYFL